uniref:Innate immunity activator a n=1 Tax=Takifugu rubripes TaxID=31033 RepID=H2UWQ0_TAKRU
MTTIESKEEISDTDSGIVLHSGPDSPTSSLKDLTTNTRALKLKHQSLEERLGLCLLELRQLCIREAELTGKMPSDYPLMPDENPPQVRRRIGASFKLDESVILLDKEDAELQTLETDLAVHQQIYEAARKLSLEEHLSKPQKKSRLQQFKREEKKVKQLQEALFQHRNKSKCNSPYLNIPLSPPVLETSFSDPLHSSPPSLKKLGVKSERSPIQNSPWKESSLDKPYQRSSKPQSSSADRIAEGSRGRGRLPQRCCVANFMVRSPEYSPLRPSLSSSEDSSSEHSSSSYISSPGRDGPTEIPKLCPPPYGFHLGAQKKSLTSFTSTRATMEDGPLSPQGPEVETPCLSPPPVANAPPQWRERALSPNRILKPPPPYTRLVRTPSLKEYPNHAIRLLPRELVSEELKSWHQRIQLQKVQPGSTRCKCCIFINQPIISRLFSQGSGNMVLQRDPDGTPVQWFVAEDAEIVSQV